MYFKYCVFLLTAFVFCLISCSPKNPAFKAESFRYESGNVLPYNIFYPKNYKSAKSEKYPLLIFLHGAGERGEDNIKQLIHIAPKLIQKETRTKYPAVLLFPQCPENDYWAPVKRLEWTFDSGAEATQPMKMLMGLVDKILQDPKIDKKRIYIAGLSMGGFGTFDYLSRRPELFAAAIPICGGADTAVVHNYKNVPLWIFHGAKDPVVSVELSRMVVQKLISAGVEPKYTEYPDGGHDIWNIVFDDPETLRWLFSQKKL